MDAPSLQTFPRATLYDMILLIAFTEFHGQTNWLWPKQLTYLNATNAHINTIKLGAQEHICLQINIEHIYLLSDVHVCV